MSGIKYQEQNYKINLYTLIITANKMEDCAGITNLPSIQLVPFMIHDAHNGTDPNPLAIIY